MTTRSPISLLQELCVSQHYILPKYEYEENKILGNPSIFTCKCFCNDFETSANAGSKKDAKTVAAEEMLKKFDVHHKLPEPVFNSTIKIEKDVLPPPPLEDLNITTSPNKKNAVSALNEYSSKNGLPYPTYTDAGFLGGKFITKCMHGSFVTEGFGIRKKDSKQAAAEKMLERFNTTGHDTALIKNPSKISDESVMEIYKMMSNKSDLIKPKEIENNNTIKSFSPSLPSINKAKTEENFKDELKELEEKLQSLGVVYKIQTLRESSPFILSFQREDHKPSENTFMEFGDTFQEAKTKLLRQALKKITMS